MSGARGFNVWFESLLKEARAQRARLEELARNQARLEAELAKLQAELQASAWLRSREGEK